MHVIFYANQTFYSLSYFVSRGETVENGTWTRIERGSYSTLSADGEITNWTYDPQGDSLYETSVPQRKYYRYRG